MYQKVQEIKMKLHVLAGPLEQQLISQQELLNREGFRMLYFSLRYIVVSKTDYYTQQNSVIMERENQAFL